MSTGLNCEFIEEQPGYWYYVLENGWAPKNAWDWHDHATAYGRFNSREEAHEHLSANHANPGGSSTTNYRPDNKIGETLMKLFKEARK